VYVQLYTRIPTTAVVGGPFQKMARSKLPCKDGASTWPRMGGATFGSPVSCVGSIARRVDGIVDSPLDHLYVCNSHFLQGFCKFRARPASLARPASSTARPASSTARPASSTARPTSSTTRPTSSTARPASSTARLASSTARPASSTAR
jgi:hypothetical protein